jgi:hypothetical protein
MIIPIFADTMQRVVVLRGSPAGATSPKKTEKATGEKKSMPPLVADHRMKKT